MRSILIVSLSLVVLLTQVAPLYALDDSIALSGLTSTRAIFDVRTSDENTLQFILTVIRDTLDETNQQGVKTHYVVSMRGSTVKLLVRARHGDDGFRSKTITLVDELNQRGVRLEACGYALNLFGLEKGDLYAGIDVVGNSLNSLIAYQLKGYALVTMN